MELKLERCDNPACLKRSQSYLSGIEINIRQARARKNKSSQSYLIGIEILPSIEWRTMQKNNIGYATFSLQ